VNKLAKHPGGRPTKFHDGMYKQITEYISMCGREQMSLPTIEGLADYLDVTSDTIRRWSKENQEFSATVKRILDKQKIQLMQDGMYGGKEVNAAMAIFLLKANHGLKDGGNQTNVQVNVSPILGGQTNEIQAGDGDTQDTEAE